MDNAHRNGIHRGAWRWFVSGYASAVALLSLLPAGTLKRVSFLAELGDKWAHFGLYALLAFACCRAWMERVERRPGALAVMVAACTAYGLVLECLQGAIPALQRTFSVGDILANVLGAISGAGLWARVNFGREQGSAHE